MRATAPVTPPATVDPASARLQRQWVKALDAAERGCRDFLDEGKRVVGRYRNESKVGNKSRRKGGTPILYANTEQLRSALLQKPPKPDVRRRFSDRDPVGQQAAETVERALTYLDDTGDGFSAVSAALQDLLLPGRGVVRLEYEPVIAQRQAVDPVTGQPLFETDDDGEPTDEPAMVDFLADQKLHQHYVFWPDYLQEPARRWANVGWIAFRHVMSRDALDAEVFGNAPPESVLWPAGAAAVPLDWIPDGEDRTKVDDTFRKAEVWEVWDKLSATRLWIVKTAPAPLRIDEDPYGLVGFFPVPEPLVAYSTNDSAVPQALFRAYEDQADDLDELTRRISTLTKALKRRGVYDQSVPELRRLANAGDNEFIPAANYAALATKGGLAASMQTEDISVLAGVILQLSKQRDVQVQAIYEISGISDIMRGSTDPDETLGAQQLKAQTGSMRLRRMQMDVQRFIRDLLRIEVDLMCRHFDPATLSRMTNMPVTPEIAQALRSDALRGFMVDIETDSTVFADAAQMQQSRAQVLSGMTQLITAMAPIVQQRPTMGPLLFKMLEWGMAPAHDARMLQDALDQAQQAIEQQAAQPQQPQADPTALAKAQTAQAQASAAQTKAQAEAAKGQTAIQVAQIQAQGVAAKAQADLQSTALQTQQQREAHAQDMLNAQAQHDQAMAHAAQTHAQDMQAQALAGAQKGPPGQLGSDPHPLAGATQAPDGHFYVALPHGGGQFHRVTANG